MVQKINETWVEDWNKAINPEEEIKEMKTPTEEEFIEILYKGLKQSYPDCKESIKEEFNNIKNSKSSQNIIKMWIEKDVQKYLSKLKEVKKDENI